MNKVIQVAEEIDLLSRDYYLAHAVDACEKYLFDILSKTTDAENQKKEKDILDGIDIDDEVSMSVRQHLFVDYANIEKDGARVVEIEGNIEIVIPKKKDEQNLHEYKSSIRFILAHELAHVVLHYDSILRGTNGSKEITDPAKEKEANLFAKTLLDLKQDYFETVLTDSAYKFYTVN